MATESLTCACYRWLLLIGISIVLVATCHASDSASEPNSLQPRLKAHQGVVGAIAFSPSGRTIATGGHDGTICIWDVSQRVLVKKLGGHTGGVYALTYSRDGKLLISAGADRMVLVWTASGQRVHELKGHNDKVAAAAISTNGKIVASGGYDQTIRLWDLTSGRPIGQLDGFEGRITTLAFSSNDKILFAGGFYRSTINLGAGNQVRSGQSQLLTLWDVEKRKLVSRNQCHADSVVLGGGTLAATGIVTEVNPKPNGRSVIGVDRTAVMDSATGEIVYRLEGKGSALAMDPDGHLLVTAGGSVFHCAGFGAISGGGTEPDECLSIWEVATGTKIASLPEHDEDRYMVVSIAPTKSNIAIGTSTGNLILIDVKTLVADPNSPPRNATDLKGSWQNLGSKDGKVAFRAMFNLATDIDKVAEFLESHVHPIPHSDGDTFRQLTKMLGAADFEIRKKATEQLGRYSSSFEPGLRDLFETSEAAEDRMRLAQVRKVGAFGSSDLETLRASRAIQVLERIGSVRSERILDSLAKGAPSAKVTQEARSALERLRISYKK